MARAQARSDFLLSEGPGGTDGSLILRMVYTISPSIACRCDCHARMDMIGNWHHHANIVQYISTRDTDSDREKGDKPESALTYVRASTTHELISPAARSHTHGRTSWPRSRVKFVSYADAGCMPDTKAGRFQEKKAATPGDAV